MDPHGGSGLGIGTTGALVGNLLMLGVILFAVLAQDHSGSLLRISEVEWTPTDFYRQVLQEDETVEWSTFWGFVFASGAFVLAAARQRRSTGQVPWFLVGLASFCALFSLEEISWGQRLIGYRPPVYFLEHNFQQELNFHNAMGKGLREPLLQILVLSYGVLLPGIARLRPIAARLERGSLVPPPAALIPSFLVAVVLHRTYPFEFSGELVELMLAFGFLFAGIAGVLRFGTGEGRGRAVGWMPVLLLLVAGLVTIGAGAASAGIWRMQRAADPALISQARQETEALSRDFLRMQTEHGMSVTACGLHRRVFRFVDDYRRLAGREPISRWSYQALVDQGLPPERAEYFLDPWNLPYWVRHECETVNGKERVRAYVYSFGPNRRRDSTKWEIRGDDVGTYFEPMPRR